MNNVGKLIMGILLLLGVAAAAYWFGTREASKTHEATSAAKAERKILYYRNAMGLPDTSPEPKKDSMGMDYVPVYEGDAEAGDQLSISIEKVQRLGVKTEPAAMRELSRKLRITGRIETDERRTYTIAPKFEGWVERLYVNATGQAVAKGQALFDVYSPDLVSAQREYALALQGLASLQGADEDAKKSMQRLADASRARLQNWGIAPAQSSPADNAEARPYVTFRAPISGTVLEKKAVQGMRFMPGEILYQIADLSSVWVIAEVPEQDIGQVKVGSHAQVTVDAYPDRAFDGRVNFIYPTLNSNTRTVQVRLEIANPKGLLKPAMFASVQLAGEKSTAPVLSIPVSAVIDSGTRQVALVQVTEGRFSPRDLKLGQRTADYVEVLSGLEEGEQVVTKANFLLDAESNLKAALGNAPHQHGGTAPAAPQQAKEQAKEQPGAEQQPAAQEKQPAMEHHHAD